MVANKTAERERETLAGLRCFRVAVVVVAAAARRRPSSRLCSLLLHTARRDVEAIRREFGDHELGASRHIDRRHERVFVRKRVPIAENNAAKESIYSRTQTVWRLTPFFVAACDKKKRANWRVERIFFERALASRQRAKFRRRVNRAGRREQKLGVERLYERALRLHSANRTTGDRLRFESSTAHIAFTATYGSQKRDSL